MIRAMWTLQWHWLRTPIGFFTLAALAIPIMTLARRESRPYVTATDMVSSGEITGILLGILAALTGIVAGVVTWQADRRNDHSYALSLPIRRDRYVWWRSLGTVLALGIPAAGAWAGIVAATSTVALAPGLQVYAGRTSVHMAVAMGLVSCLTTFVIRGLTTRGRRWALIGVAALLLASLVESVALPETTRPVSEGLRLLIVGEYSPLAAVFPRWKVIDL